MSQPPKKKKSVRETRADQASRPPPKPRRTTESLFEPEYDLPPFKPSKNDFGGANEGRYDDIPDEDIDTPIDTAYERGGRDLFQTNYNTSSGTGRSGSSKLIGGNGKQFYAPCYEKHPAYEVDTGLFIWGGSCSKPVKKDADIYVGLDSYMHVLKSIPGDNAPQHFLFEIKNMSVPKDEDLKEVATWLAKQVKAGKTVHIGCIGGHGRTGLLLASIRHILTGDTQAIQHVRKHYCDKAVESQEQIDQLVRIWGIDTAAPRYFDHKGKKDWKK